MTDLPVHEPSSTKHRHFFTFTDPNLIQITQKYIHLYLQKNVFEHVLHFGCALFSLYCPNDVYYSAVAHISQQAASAAAVLSI